VSFFLWSTVVVALLSGCSDLVRPTEAPALVASEQYTQDNLSNDLVTYQSATDKTPVRNKIIFGLAAQIDANYRDFSDSFYLTEGALNTALDIAVIGLGSAGALTGGATAKAILAATSAGLTGSRVAFAKNFFQEKGPDLIRGRMNALRAQRWVVIYGKLNVPASKYSLDEATRDLVQYYDAGTITGAYDSISADSGDKLVQANTQLSEEIQKKYGSQLLLPEDASSDKILVARLQRLENGKLALDENSETPITSGKTPDVIACNILKVYDPNTVCSASSLKDLRDLVGNHSDKVTDDKLNQAFVTVASTPSLH
jgi:hypothetical protein